jgi:hypothetical protein
MRHFFRLISCLAVAALLSACASQPPAKLDYTAYKASKPRSILVLPPLNNSPDVNASYSVLSLLTYPLAESGYYVLPVALVDSTFKQNGLTVAGDIHQVPRPSCVTSLVPMRRCMSPSANMVLPTPCWTVSPWWRLRPGWWICARC